MAGRPPARPWVARAAVADEFRPDRLRPRCRADRIGIVRAWSDCAPDEWVRIAAVSARQRRIARRERAVAGRADVTSARVDWTSSPAGALRGEIRVPGHKP